MENKDPIMEILTRPLREAGYILCRRTGRWREEKANGFRDSGFYLEAVEIPRDQPRYLQISYQFLDEENETGPLARGFAVWLAIDRTDLISRAC